jgi:hypothetical protein
MSFTPIRAVRRGRAAEAAHPGATYSPGAAHAGAWRGVLVLAVSALVLTPGPCRADGGEAPDLADILSRYNAFIEWERSAVESLQVRQTMVEPKKDGTSKKSEAELVYTRAGGMDRRVVFSEISNPAGDYTLDSLIGPELLEAEYALAYAGRDTVEGEETYHVLVTALSRDSKHFDGDVWISSAGFAPVRVTGRVADPPFPVVLITLDKSFDPGPGGLRLLRRHSGEAEVNLLLGTRRGLRHIFYDDYSVRVREDE